MLTLRPIDEQTLFPVTRLSVAPAQREFVADNTWSIMEAYIALSRKEIALPFGLYDGETPVGFVMFSYGSYPGAPQVAVGNYAIWRLMIDHHHQGKGYGKQAMQAALAYLRTRPAGDAQSVWLSYEPTNELARHLYHSFGFVENGAYDGHEIIAVRRLDQEESP